MAAHIILTMDFARLKKNWCYALYLSQTLINIRQSEFNLFGLLTANCTTQVDIHIHKTQHT